MVYFQEGRLLKEGCMGYCKGTSKYGTPLVAVEMKKFMKRNDTWDATRWTGTSLG